MIRGLRNSRDAEYESEYRDATERLATNLGIPMPEIDLSFSSIQNRFISSTIVRSLLTSGQPLRAYKGFLPDAVAEEALAILARRESRV